MHHPSVSMKISSKRIGRQSSYTVFEMYQSLHHNLKTLSNIDMLKRTQQNVMLYVRVQRVCKPRLVVAVLATLGLNDIGGSAKDVEVLLVWRAFSLFNKYTGVNYKYLHYWMLFATGFHPEEANSSFDFELFSPQNVFPQFLDFNVLLFSLSRRLIQHQAPQA